MIRQLAEILQPVLNWPYVRRTRRNHGLEHATIHLLNAQGYILSGRSSDRGFVILGNVPTEKLESAAHNALRRMRNGEHQLAIHPNCGTNLLTLGGMATLAALVGFSGASDYRARWSRFPMVLLMMMVTALFAPSVGMRLQKYITTEGNPGDLEIISISKRTMPAPLGRGEWIVHQVVTQGG